MKKESKQEKIGNYLKENYTVKTPILMEEVYEEFNSYSKSTVRSAIKRLFDQGKLDRIDEGIYGIKDEKNILGRSSVSISDVIKKKYIEKDGEVFGYVSGINFSNSLGLTTQVGSTDIINSNVTSCDKREVLIDKNRIILRKPKIQINNKNFKVLQVLDLLDKFDEYSEMLLIETPKYILDYLDNVSLTFNEIDLILSKYPIETQIKFYKLGVYHVITL